MQGQAGTKLIDTGPTSHPWQRSRQRQLNCVPSGGRRSHLDARVPHLTWHQIARFVRTSGSPAWDDFLDYMAENAMTDTYDDPATNAEIAATSGFDGLGG